MPTVRPRTSATESWREQPIRLRCPSTKDRFRGGVMNNAVVICGQIRMPEWVKDLDSFHRWTESPDYPDSGWFSYFRGEIWVDTSMEELNHNQLKGVFAIVVGGLVLTERLGRYLHDRMRLSNPDVDLSSE